MLLGRKSCLSFSILRNNSVLSLLLFWHFLFLGNKLKRLPQSACYLRTYLRRILLHDNLFQYFPRCLLACSLLSVVTLSNNPFMDKTNSRDRVVFDYLTRKLNTQVRIAYH